jgi:hypothetical protein
VRFRIPTLLLILVCFSAPAAAETESPRDELFDAGSSPDVLLLASEDEREAFASSLEDAGRNWTELADAIGGLDGQEREAAVWLVNGMPHLDRLEMSAATLAAHVTYAFRAASEMPYPVPEDMFRPYILTYRIEEEPVESWRPEFFALFGQIAERESTVEATAMAVNFELADRIGERDREFFGPRQSPFQTLRSGRGTKTEIAILACAAMKAIGIPSRQAGVRALGSEPGGASWIEVYDGEAWLPFYPLEPDAFGDRSHVEREHSGNVTAVSTSSAFERVLVTADYTETGTLDLWFVENGEPAAAFEHFAVSVLNRGALVPLDELDAIADEDGRFLAELGEGSYVVQAGMRDALGNPYVMMREAAVAPGETTLVAFDVTLEGRETAHDRAASAALGAVLHALVCADLDGEPSRRMLPLIAGALGMREENVLAEYVLVDDDPGRAISARSIVGEAANVRVVPPADGRLTTEAGHTIDFAAELPVVLIYETEGAEVILRHEGYDLNIERVVTAAIDEFTGRRPKR